MNALTRVAEYLHSFLWVLHIRDVSSCLLPSPFLGPKVEKRSKYAFAGTVQVAGPGLGMAPIAPKRIASRKIAVQQKRKVPSPSDAACHNFSHTTLTIPFIHPTYQFGYGTIHSLTEWRTLRSWSLFCRPPPCFTSPPYFPGRQRREACVSPCCTDGC
jgi:hypothetical protein